MRRTYEDFKREADEYENIVKEYLETHEKFIDPNFHPTLHIKEYNKKLNVNDSIDSYIRLEEEYNSPLFKKENINPNFIHQGSLGDCYFLCGIGRLSMQPSLIHFLFETEIPNKYFGEVENSINLDCGAVVIYFWWFGQKTPVLIDTLMPTKNGKLQFSSPIDKTKSAFFCYIEKAFAKLNGSYSNIINGNISIAIHSMFGNYYPIYKSINDLKNSAIKSKSTVFEKLMKYQNQKLAVIEANIHLDDSSLSEQEIKNKNLHINHSYLIMKVVRVKALNGLILICLQNPWGHSEWNGDFSDYSTCWTPEATKELKLEQKDDGTFWMKEEDFVKYFTGINMTKSITNNMYLRSFDCQFLPESNNGRKNNSDLNVAFQFVDNIQYGEKCNFYVLVEKCHDFYDEKGAYCKYLTYQINFKHINANTFIQISTQNLSTFKHKASKNETVIISLKKLERPDITEDCYISIFSEYKFKLYNYDDPCQVYLANDIPNNGLIFTPILYGNIDEQFSIIQKFEQDRNKNKSIVMHDENSFIESYVAMMIEITNKNKQNPNSYNYKIECEELRRQINEIQDNHYKTLYENIQKEKEDLLKTIDKMKEDHENEKKKLNEDLNSKSNELNQMIKKYDTMFIEHQKEKNEKKKLLKKYDLLVNQLNQKDQDNINIKKENENMKNKLNKLKNEIGNCKNIIDENKNNIEPLTSVLIMDDDDSSEINKNISQTVPKIKFPIDEPKMKSLKSYQRFKKNNSD